MKILNQAFRESISENEKRINLQSKTSHDLRS